MTGDPHGVPELEYLKWALARYGQVKFDLGSSGMAPLPIDVLGQPNETFAGATDPTIVARWQKTIAKRFNVSVEEAVPVLGTSHGLWCTYAALLAPGSDVLVESPFYEPLVRIAEGLRARVIPFVRDLERECAIDIDEVKKRLTPQTRLVVVSNLHNPTGHALSDDTIRALANAVAPATLLVDEVYRDMLDSSASTAFHLAPNIVTTASLTKVYGLAWARAGWVLARKELASKIIDAAVHSIGAISWALASASITAVERIEELHARSRLARANDGAALAKVRAWVAERPYLSFTPGRASIFGFVVDTRGHDAKPWIERAIDEEGVVVAPGSFFGFPAGFRIRYGAIPPERLDEGLVRLGRAIDKTV
jgi:aspartate/methionine/tyrosine aminotransferase